MSFITRKCKHHIDQGIGGNMIIQAEDRDDCNMDIYMINNTWVKVLMELCFF